MSVVRFAGQNFVVGLGMLFLGFGCSDPASPTPEGAFNVSLGNASGSAVTCPASSQITVGTVGRAQRSTVVDGQDGATVSCRVVKAGSGFRANGTIIRGTSRFDLNPVAVGEGNSNQGTVSVSAAVTAGKAYGPSSETPCEFNVIEAAEGRIWMSFECPLIATGSSESEKCAIYEGYVVFENCITG